jgi:hypothetical protein
MKKAFVLFGVSILCSALAIRYFHPDFSWFTEASGEDSSNIEDMNQPMPHAVMPTADDNWVDMESYKVNFPVLLGHDELSRKLGFEGWLPASILVTRDGKEVKIIRGPVKAQEVSRAIKHLL